MRTLLTHQVSRTCQASVICFADFNCAQFCFAAESQAQPLIDRLDPHTRAKVVLALAGLVMLGLLMMGLTWLAFRTLRKQFRRTDAVIEKQKQSATEDAWAGKPLVDRSQEAS